MKGHMMNIEIGMDEIINKIIVFQEMGYNGRAIYRYIVEHENVIPVEIFPGIFLSLKEERGIKKIVKSLVKKEYRSIVFDVQNVRDRFEFIDLENECAKHEREELITKVEEISPNDILYPNNLGGGECGGCKITSYFSGLVVTGTYRIIDDSDVVEQTKLEPYFINKCKSSRCYQTYLKIEKEGYKNDLPKREMIHIDVQNGRYVPMEGKHRVCAMKRYDYSNRITARITYGDDREYSSYRLVNYGPSDRDLMNYYKCFEEYGLNRDDVLNYLSNQSKTLCKMIIEKNELNELRRK